MPRSQPADRGVAYFAAFLDLLHKKVVVVGGGRVASTKVRSLLPCQPEPLVVVAPRASHAHPARRRAGQLTWHQRDYAPEDLAGASLAFGATDDRQLNARVAADARRLGIPVLAVDDVPNCDFIAPAIVRRGDVTVADLDRRPQPGHGSPHARAPRAALPPFWGDLLDVAADARERLGGYALGDRARPLAVGAPRRGRVPGVASARCGQQPTCWSESWSARCSSPKPTRRGLVSLVGAGPGAADLLTLRAVERLRAADVVVHDRLVSDAVLEHAAPSAERIDVGKRPGGRGASQDDINTLAGRPRSGGSPRGPTQRWRPVRLRSRRRRSARAGRGGRRL